MYFARKCIIVTTGHSICRANKGTRRFSCLEAGSRQQKLLIFWLIFPLPAVMGFKHKPVVKLALWLGKQTACFLPHRSPHCSVSRTGSQLRSEQVTMEFLSMLHSCLQGRTLSEINCSTRIFSWFFSELLFILLYWNKQVFPSPCSWNSWS